MNKKELKTLLKPLIKECIKEVVFEEGVLSGIITEVMKGVGTAQTAAPAPVTGRSSVAPQQSAPRSDQRQKMLEHKKQLLDAIGRDSYNGVNLFEGTSALASRGSAPGASPAAQGPLADVSPDDPGVDIGPLFGAVGTNWSAHMGKK